MKILHLYKVFIEIINNERKVKNLNNRLQFRQLWNLAFLNFVVNKCRRITDFPSKYI